MKLGERLKELRKSKGLSLTELSEQSGVQIATLSRMENNKMTGTLESHLNIARALGIDVTQLYSTILKEEKTGQIDVRTAKSATDVYVHSKESSSEMLVSQVFGKKMLPLLIKLGTGGKTPREENKLGTEKFIYVLEGKIKVAVGQDTYELGKNNSLYFDASLPHQITNIGKAEARVMGVGTPLTL